MVCPGNGFDDDDLYAEPRDSLDDDLIAGDEDDEYEDQEPILSTYNPEDVNAIKSVLEENEIPYHFEGDSAVTGKTFTDPARLYVQKDMADEARELIEDLDLTYMSLSPEEDPVEYEDFDGDDLEDN